MDLDALKTFRRAVEAGNLTAAANALHITKSVASRRLRALEADMGVRLLHRTTRGVHPTDEGARYYERIARILDDLDDARQDIADTDGPLTGHLRLTAPRSFADLHMVRAFAAFMADNPNLTLEMNLTDERVDIISGGYDVGFRIAQSLDDTSLIGRRLTAIENRVVASPAYVATYGAPEVPEDLKHHNCFFYSNVAASQQWRFGDGAAAKAVRVQGTGVSNSGQMQKMAAVAGLGVTAIPYFFVHEELADGRLVSLLEEYPRPSSALYALYPERRHLSPRVRGLIDFMADWFARPEHNSCL